MLQRNLDDISSRTGRVRGDRRDERGGSGVGRALREARGQREKWVEKKEARGVRGRGVPV